MLQYRRIYYCRSLAHHITSSDYCEQHKRVDAHALVLFTSPDAVDGVATCDQHKRGDVSVRLVGITNPQQIEVMEFALIVAVSGDGDYSRQCGRGFTLLLISDNGAVLYGDYANASYKQVTYSAARRLTSISLIRSSHHVVICTFGHVSYC